MKSLALYNKIPKQLLVSYVDYHSLNQEVRHIWLLVLPRFHPLDHHTQRVQHPTSLTYTLTPTHPPTHPPTHTQTHTQFQLSYVLAVYKEIAEVVEKLPLSTLTGCAPYCQI